MKLVAVIVYSGKWAQRRLVPSHVSASFPIPESSTVLARRFRKLFAFTIKPTVFSALNVEQAQLLRNFGGTGYFPPFHTVGPKFQTFQGGLNQRCLIGVFDVHCRMFSRLTCFSGVSTCSDL